MKRLLPAATFVASRLADTSLPEIIARLIRASCLPLSWRDTKSIEHVSAIFSVLLGEGANLSKILIEGRVALLLQSRIYNFHS